MLPLPCLLLTPTLLATVWSFTRATATGTPAGSAYVDTITAGTGFTIKSVASDTNAYKYCILPVYPL